MTGANDVRVHPLAPVMALDIDGTLGDYYNHFHWFAQLYTQRSIPVDWGHRGLPISEFSDALGMTKEEYRQIKLAYRQGGMKRCLPPFPDIRPLVQGIRRQNVQVWICTTRPWNRLDNIDPDTQFWINREIGKVDGVIYGEDKYEDLVDIVGKERVLGAVDDLPENINRALNLGIPALIRRGQHNQFYEAPKSWQVADSSSSIAAWCFDVISDHKEGLK